MTLSWRHKFKDFGSKDKKCWRENNYFDFSHSVESHSVPVPEKVNFHRKKRTKKGFFGVSKQWETETP